METKNIVTIDFDIIMAPSIEIYNLFVSEINGVNYFAEQENHLLSFCNADLSIYSALSFYIYRMFEILHKEQIHFVYDHDQICKYIESDKKYNIYNIDHHHDCGYHHKNQMLYCGNWVIKLKEQNIINNYTWITDYSASNLPDDIGNKKLIYDYDLYSLPSPDILVICLSPSWIPKQFLPLFDIWIDFYNIYFNEGEPLIIEENDRIKQKICYNINKKEVNNG